MLHRIPYLQEYLPARFQPRDGRKLHHLDAKEKGIVGCISGKRNTAGYSLSHTLLYKSFAYLTPRLYIKTHFSRLVVHHHLLGCNEPMVPWRIFPRTYSGLIGRERLHKVHPAQIGRRQWRLALGRFDPGYRRSEQSRWPMGQACLCVGSCEPGACGLWRRISVILLLLQIFWQFPE